MPGWEKGLPLDLKFNDREVSRNQANILVSDRSTDTH